MAFNPEVQKRRKSAKTITLNGPKETTLKPYVGNELDSDDAKDTLHTLESWYNEQVDYHATNRREQLIDNDFYDHDQWDQESIEILAERNQAALVFNLIAPVVNWLVGTERRTRVDWGVYPRSSEATEIAEAKAKVLKFISDTSGAGFERSKAFKDAVISGVGWTREFVQMDAADGPPVAERYVNWKSVRWDPYSRSDTLEDCRSISVERYIDLDYAIAMFPDRHEELTGAALRTIDPGMELLADDSLMPQVFWGQRASLMSQFGLTGTASVGRRQRPRVRLIETEYRRPVVTRKVRALVDDYCGMNGSLYDPTDAAMNDLRNTQKITLDDKLEDKIWLGIWHPCFLCTSMQTPYRHNRFSLTPTWCYRRHRDGMPYGIVRGLRDPQDEYNKRRSKALFALSTNRLIYEADAIEEGDEDEVREEAAKPNAQIRLKSGGLDKFQITDNVAIADAHIKLLEISRQDIHEGSSVTPENQGLETQALSGVAIKAKQQQGAVGTAEIFDNYRQSIQISGTKTLSLCEQYVTQPMEIRILGEKEAEFLKINQPTFDPVTGQVLWGNDITSDQADFLVDEQDFRETTRQAQAEMLMDTISKMPPQLSIQLLDLVIDLSDVPNREEFVKRIKAINGADQREQAPSPEEQAAQEQQAAEQAQAQAQEQDLSKREREAKLAKDNASANKLNADANHKTVETKGAAMNVAHSVALTPGLAPAADRLANAPPGNVPLSPQPLPAPLPNGAQFPQLMPQ